jgi:hypothetical protein
MMLASTTTSTNYYCCWYSLTALTSATGGYRLPVTGLVAVTRVSGLVQPVQVAGAN